MSKGAAGAVKERVVGALRSLDAVTRRRLGLAAGVLLVGVTLFAACGGCGKRAPSDKDASSPGRSGQGARSSDGGGVVGVVLDAASLRDPFLWGNAKDGDVEDLATLAVHEGAAGLVEATSDVALRPTALRAMAYAQGWAQLPFLARAATGKDDGEADAALDATLELATRPRRSEDPEDAEELGEGCDRLASLARDASRPRLRRIRALRALRMMPCPPRRSGEELPVELDAK